MDPFGSKLLYCADLRPVLALKPASATGASSARFRVRIAVRCLHVCIGMTYRRHSLLDRRGPDETVAV